MSLYKLSIKDLRLWVYLGCSDEERTNKQMVSINIKLIFANPPAGVTTDNLSDTICYFQLVELIENYLLQRNFNLLEHLTLNIHKILITNLHNQGYKDIKLKIIINKISSPVPNLHGGVSFTIEN